MFCRNQGDNLMSWDGCWFVGINFLGKEKPSVDEVDVILLIGETKMPCPWSPPWFSPDSCSMTMTRGRISIWIFPKIVGFPPKSSILIGFSIINHPFGGTPIFGNTHISQWIEFPYLPRVVVWPKKMTPMKSWNFTYLVLTATLSNSGLCKVRLGISPLAFCQAYES